MKFRWPFLSLLNPVRSRDNRSKEPLAIPFDRLFKPKIGQLFALTSVTVVDGLVSVVVFVLVLSLYVRTLAPDLLWGDSGEFQTLVYTLGMTHPTGYPVYLLLGRLFAFLPLGNLAMRVSLFSAVCGALACTLVFLLLRVIKGRRLPALGAALAMGVTPLFWWQAVIAELYTIASLLIAVVLLLVTAWRRTNQPRFLFWAGLIGGLSLGVHNTVALIGPAVLVMLLLTKAKRLDWGFSLAGTISGVLLALGAFLVLDAYDAPVSYYNTTLRHAVSIWNLTPDQISHPWGRLKFLYGARQFTMYMFSDPLQVMPTTWKQYVTALKNGFSSAFLLLSALGTVISLAIKDRWRESLLFLLSWVGMLGFILNYTIGDIQVFYVPTFVPLALAVGLGGTVILDGAGWLFHKFRFPVLIRQLVILILGSVLILIMLFPAYRWVASSWKLKRISFLKPDTWEASYPYPVASPGEPRRTAEFLVKKLEPDAMVFTSWDKVFPYYFVAALEQRKTGMSFYEEFVQDGMTGAAASTLAFIDANLGKHPIYFDHDPFPNVKQRYVLSKVSGAPWILKVERKR